MCEAFVCCSYSSDKPLTDPAVFKCVRVSYGWLNWPGDIDIGADDVWAETVRDFSSPFSAGSKAKLKNS